VPRLANAARAIGCRKTHPQSANFRAGLHLLVQISTRVAAQMPYAPHRGHRRRTRAVDVGSWERRDVLVAAENAEAASDQQTEDKE
jgi:hypothetical protein